jgi:hypothetical protein
MAHYFWRALQRRNDIELFVTGPFFGDWIPWNGGMQLPQKYVMYPDLPLPSQSARMLVDPLMIEVQMPEHMRNPDLWLQVDAGWHLSKRPNANVVAHVQTDPHCIKQTYILPKSYSDFNFCMQSCYMEDGEHFLPYAYDPELHFLDPEKEKINDACLVGLHYEQRSALVMALRSKGYKVHYSIGEVYDEFRSIYNQSKIALSWSSMQDTPTRVWEALGFGNLLVANRTPDLATFFVDNEHYLGFSNLEEGVSKVEWALSNWDEAQKIIDAGHRKVNGHTWDRRVTQLLETCRVK